MYSKFDEQDIRRFYNYFKHKNKIEIRVFDKEKYPKGKSVFVTDEKEFLNIVQKYQTENVDIYIGGRERTGTSSDDVISSDFIFLEIDEHDNKKEKEIQKLENFLEQHNIQIGMKSFSGGGYHYYIPHEKFEFTTEHERENYKKFLLSFRDALIQNKIDIDTGTFDLPRVTRIIGSYNFRRKHLSKILELNENINLEKNLKSLQTLAIQYKQKEIEPQNSKPITTNSEMVYPEHKIFWECFLSTKFPEGGINSILEKNFAIWCVQNNFLIPLKEIQNSYKKMNWSSDPFEKYLENIQNNKYWSKDKDGNPKQPEYNYAELLVWCKKNHAEHLEELLKESKKTKKTYQQVMYEDQFKETKNGKRKLKILTAEDIDNVELDTSFIVENFLFPQSRVMIFAPDGGLKSILCLSMAMAIASGEDWLELKTKKYPVLYCDKENSLPRLIKNRFSALKKGLKIQTTELKNFYFTKEGNLDQEFIEQLLEEIDEKKIKVIFLDTLRSFGDLREDKSDDAKKIQELFDTLLDKDISIVFLHHTTKDGGNYRGSSAWQAMVDDSYHINRKEKTGFFSIVSKKGRAGEQDTIHGEIQFLSLPTENTTRILDEIRLIRKEEAVEIENKSEFRNILSKIKEFVPHDKPFKRADIAFSFANAEIPFSDSTMKRCLKWMVDKQMLYGEGQNELKKGFYLFKSMSGNDN